MDFVATRSYRGAVKLVIFDWAGTVVDHGCCAPAVAFIRGFKRKSVAITMAQAREPMGMEKRDHIKAVSVMGEVAREWQRVHGKPLNERDIDAMYADFVPILLEVLTDYSSVIPGVVDAVESLRKLGVKIGGSTGYFKDAAEVVARCAAIEGYTPDYSISSSEVAAGRPAPWMIFRVMEELQICPPEAVVNVGDTVVDIKSGLNAGVWTVGVARIGNETGLSLAEIEQMDASSVAVTVDRARKKLGAAGAHYVVDSVMDIPHVVRMINERLARGEKP
jgi:phosphonoacetaldehyde hydrolase